MSFTPQHGKMPLLEVLPNSLGTEVSTPPLVSGCLAATVHVKWAVSQHGELCRWARTQMHVMAGHMCLSISVLSSGLRYPASPCTHQGVLGVLHDPERLTGQGQIGLSSPGIQQGKAQVGKIWAALQTLQLKLEWMSVQV